MFTLLIGFAAGIYVGRNYEKVKELLVALYNRFFGSNV